MMIHPLLVFGAVRLSPSSGQAAETVAEDTFVSTATTVGTTTEIR